jgi:signal transduction histidine kinase
VFAAPCLLGLAAVVLLLARRPKPTELVAPVVLAVAVASLATTAYWSARPDDLGKSTWELLLTAELMVLVGLVCRWSSRVWAAAVAPVAVVAEAVLIEPVTHAAPRWGWETLAECAFWSLAGLVGAAAGLYLRALDQRRADAVRAARRAQRVQLAADLHDYVAHDVSAMVVQAQAARVLLGPVADAFGGSRSAERAAEVAAVLDRIEADGARALVSMERSIRVLRERDDGAAEVVEPLPGLADVPDLVQRYADAGDGQVRLTMTPPDAELRGEAGNAAYRVVLEALTNVRKHAGPGTDVTVELTAGAHAVTVAVENAATSRRRSTAATTGGLGLVGLAERVESFGGTFSAGPVGDVWRVRAEIPR